MGYNCILGQYNISNMQWLLASNVVTIYTSTNKTLQSFSLPNLRQNHIIELTFWRNGRIINQIGDRDTNILKALSNIFTDQPLDKRQKESLYNTKDDEKKTARYQ